MTEAQKQCATAYKQFKRSYELQGIQITCIPEPPPMEEIENYGLKIDERMFRRMDIPEAEFELDENGDVMYSRFKEMDDRYEQDTFVPMLLKKRTEGHWFYCKDKLEYITGDHWYYLNVSKIPVVKTVKGIRRRISDHPFFVDADRDFFLFWRQAEENTGCFGVIFTSSRRVGKTFKGLSILLNNATMIPEAKCGIQAQNKNMAGSIFKRLVKMWRMLNRHWLFYPAHKGNSDPSDALEFTQPSRRSTKIQYFNYETTLESVIDYRSTTENAYDSEGLWRLYIDEASKMENCNIMNLYNIVREVLSDGSEALGKMLITSTAENLGGKTLQQYETLWKESNVKTMDAFGTTASGLYSYFQPATKGYRHSAKEDGKLPKELNKSTIDKWGYSDEDTARKVLLYLRKNKSGDSLIHFIRKYPLNSKEAFMYAEVVSALDINRINQHINFNEEVESLRKQTVRGELDWLHGVPDTEVVWIPKEDGMWEMFMLPEEEDRNQVSYIGKNRSPARERFVSSCDPFSHKIVQDEKRMSMAGSHVMTVAGGKYSDRTFVMQYHGRRSDPNDFFEDMIKQCVFYSCKILPENQKYEIINYFSKRGYGGYIERNPLNEKEELGISTRGESTRTEMVNALSSYVKQEVGQQENGSYKDQPFTRLLEDWKEFDSENWTKYDLTVSAMICIIMNLKKKERKYVAPSLAGMIQKYDLKGR